MDMDFYDSTDFSPVNDRMSANTASILASSVAPVNCPILSVEE
jgi:hypothetical protein